MLFYCTRRIKAWAPVLGRNQTSVPQVIMENLIEVYYLDEWFVITSYVAGLLHSAMFWKLITILLKWEHCGVVVRALDL